MEKERCCGTCVFHKPANQNGGLAWVCENEEADAYAWETDYKDSCEDYEGKED